MTPQSACSFMLLFLGVHFASCTAVNQLLQRSDVNRGEISSPLKTNWGEWTSTTRCPKQHFVTGMQLKTEHSQRKKDDTALNAIRFICSAYGTSGIDASLTPHEGFWGNWGTIFRCGGSDVAVGFELRSELGQGKSDDTAANNLRLICNNGGRVFEGDGMYWGDWTGQQLCPMNSAICGLRVQVEPRQGKSDDTALNNLVASCCDLPRNSK